MTVIHAFLGLFKRRRPFVSIDLDVFDPHNRRAVQLYCGNVTFLGRAANKGRAA